MKWKGLVILLIIIVFLLPVYTFNKYLQTKIRPRESITRFGLFMLSSLFIIFIYTFLLVFIIKKLFPDA